MQVRLGLQEPCRKVRFGALQQRGLALQAVARLFDVALREVSQVHAAPCLGVRFAEMRRQDHHFCGLLLHPGVRFGVVDAGEQVEAVRGGHHSDGLAEQAHHLRVLRRALDVQVVGLGQEAVALRQQLVSGLQGAAGGRGWVGVIPRSVPSGSRVPDTPAPRTAACIAVLGYGLIRPLVGATRVSRNMSA